MDSIAVNRANWDERAPAHAASPDYGVAQFIADPRHLSGVVRFDLPRLGDIAGLRGVHLQCHIGTDTISLARLGARMTGLDFSPAALEQARRIAHDAGTEVDFVESEVYAASKSCPVAPSIWCSPASARCAGCPTSGGGRTWSPNCYGRAVGCSFARATRCCGRSASAAPIRLSWRTRISRRPSRWSSRRTAPTSRPRRSSRRTSRTAGNHGLGEIVSALLAEGLRLTMLEEHDSVPWKALSEGLVSDEHGEYRLIDQRERLPMTYTLQAVKDR